MKLLLLMAAVGLFLYLVVARARFASHMPEFKVIILGALDKGELVEGELYDRFYLISSLHQDAFLRIMAELEREKLIDCRCEQLGGRKIRWWRKL